MAHHHHSSGGLNALVTGLGVFSIGLGALELLSPRTIDETLGLGRHENMTRFYGLREISAGLGILLSEDPTPWLWARVAGDVADLASLVPGLGAGPRERSLAAGALGSVALVTAVDLYCASALSRPRHRVSVRRHGGSYAPEEPEPEPDPAARYLPA